MPKHFAFKATVDVDGDTIWQGIVAEVVAQLLLVLRTCCSNIDIAKNIKCNFLMDQ
jgi:hypothetical protein